MFRIVLLAALSFACSSADAQWLFRGRSFYSSTCPNGQCPMNTVTRTGPFGGSVTRTYSSGVVVAEQPVVVSNSSNGGVATYGSNGGYNAAPVASQPSYGAAADTISRLEAKVKELEARVEALEAQPPYRSSGAKVASPPLSAFRRSIPSPPASAFERRSPVTLVAQR